MPNDDEKVIIELKDALDKAKNEKVRAEAKLEQLNKQKDDIIKEIETLGLSPDNIENEIKKLENEIETILKEVREMLPNA